LLLSPQKYGLFPESGKNLFRIRGKRAPDLDPHHCV
jgi:hypothetical protein